MATSQSESLAVLVHAGDRKDRLEVCVESIFAQQYFGELSVVVYGLECADQNSAELDAQPGLKSVTAANLSTALLEVDANYVALIDSADALTDSHKFAKQVAFMVDNDWCAVSHHACTLKLRPGSQMSRDELLVAQSVVSAAPQRCGAAELVGSLNVVPSTVLLRRAALSDSFLASISDLVLQEFLVVAVATASGDIGLVEGIDAVCVVDSAAPLERPQKSVAVDLDSALWMLAASLVGPVREVFRSAAISNLLTQDSRYQPQALRDVTEPLQALESGMNEVRQQLLEARNAKGELATEVDLLISQNARLRSKLQNLRRRLELAS